MKGLLVSIPFIVMKINVNIKNVYKILFECLKTKITEKKKKKKRKEKRKILNDIN